MAKSKTAFYCQHCGAQYAKWMGHCKSCDQWNTIVEEVVQKEDKRSWKQSSGAKRAARILAIDEISFSREDRLPTGFKEFDRVLGGGLVKGSVVLLGGEPGIGKSTLLLQAALAMKQRILYISGEESPGQIKLRADRIDTTHENCLIYTETNTQSMFRSFEEINPDLVIVDSIQTLHTDRIEATPGSVSQIRECTAELTTFAKETNTPVILIGHITKDGMIAGPKVLEHMVDVVLQFEGDRNHVYRIVRAIKNRFGSTAELGIFEMGGKGLAEVSNPSEILISKSSESLSGSVIAATMEGMRPLLIEVQALVSSAVYGTPQRSSTGFDTKRLNMLLAVLEKRAGFRLGAKDVFLNIAGGIRVDDPAIDLAVIGAILSSNEDFSIPKNHCFAAEIGLAGEIRPVSRIAQRISEAEKMGFKKIFISEHSKVTGEHKKIEVVKLKRVEDLIAQIF